MACLNVSSVRKNIWDEACYEERMSRFNLLYHLEINTETVYFEDGVAFQSHVSYNAVFAIVLHKWLFFSFLGHHKKYMNVLLSCILAQV